MALRKVDKDEQCTELDVIVLLYVLLGEIEVEEERLLSFQNLNSNYLLAFLVDGVSVGVHVRRSTFMFVGAPSVISIAISLLAADFAVRYYH